jgi:hypothetical protein
MLQKIRLRRKGQVVLHTEVAEVETAAEIVAEILEVMAADEANVAIEVIVAIVAVQAAADTKKAMAQVATDQLTKVEEIAEAIQAVRQPVRIQTEVAAGLQAENRGIRNKPGNRVRRRRGFSILR